MANRFVKRKIVVSVPVYLHTPKGIMNTGTYGAYKVIEYKMKIKRLKNGR